MTIVIDATDVDTWTCNQWSDMGIWTTEEYARELSSNRVHRCGAINVLHENPRWDVCRRCGAGRLTQETKAASRPYVSWSWRRKRPVDQHWFRFLPRRVRKA